MSKIISKQSAEFNAKLAHGKAALEGRDKGNKFGVECPYCHATNVKLLRHIYKKKEHLSMFYKNCQSNFLYLIAYC